MTTATLPLDQVAKQIAQQETELTALRREYTARKTQLGELTSRQQRLQAQLNQVESQIQALTLGSAPAAATAKATSQAKPQNAYTYATLPDLIVPLLREAKGKPLSTRQLTDAVMQRGFTTTSRNPYGVVKSRANELVKKGILRRAPNGAGFGLAQTKSEPAASVRTSTSTPGKSTTAPKADASQERPSLRIVLMNLLKKSPKPLTGGELARQALATGYRSSSKDFPHVVHVALRKIDGLENLPGQGYRLKKR